MASCMLAILIEDGWHLPLFTFYVTALTSQLLQSLLKPITVTGWMEVRIVLAGTFAIRPEPVFIEIVHEVRRR